MLHCLPSHRQGPATATLVALMISLGGCFGESPSQAESKIFRLIREGDCNRKWCDIYLSAPSAQDRKLVFQTYEWGALMNVQVASSESVTLTKGELFEVAEGFGCTQTKRCLVRFDYPKHTITELLLQHQRKLPWLHNENLNVYDTNKTDPTSKRKRKTATIEKIDTVWLKPSY